MCCSSPTPPAPPDYSPIAASSDKAAQLGYDAASNDLAFRKQVYQDSLPRQQQLYDLASQVAQQQLGIADENQQHANQQWQDYLNTYQPVEHQMVSDAMNYNSAARQQSVRSQAVQDVSSAVDAQNAAMARSMGRYGVNPNSGRFVGLQRTAGVLGAAQKAGAATSATRGLEDKAIALRAGAASFGRNMPNTAGQTFGLATQAGNSAVGNQNTAGLSALPYAQFAAGGYGSQIGAAGLGANTALGMGGLLNQGYGIQANMYGDQVKANAAGLQGLGQMLGSGIGAYAALSDRRLKTDVTRVGTHPLGFGIYDYTLLGKRERGVMADEVEKVKPEAVVTGPDGYKRVFYHMLETNHG